MHRSMEEFAIRSPEGPNIGLVTYMSLYAVVNSYGFLETPYRKVLKIEHGNTTKMKVTNEMYILRQMMSKVMQ